MGRDWGSVGVEGAGCFPIAEVMGEESIWYQGQRRIEHHSEAVDTGFFRLVEGTPGKTIESGDWGYSRHLAVVPGNCSPAVVEGALDMHMERCHKRLVGRNRAVVVPLCLNRSDLSIRPLLIGIVVLGIV